MPNRAIEHPKEPNSPGTNGPATPPEPGPAKGYRHQENTIHQNNTGSAEHQAGQGGEGQGQRHLDRVLLARHPEACGQSGPEGPHQLGAGTPPTGMAEAHHGRPPVPPLDGSDTSPSTADQTCNAASAQSLTMRPKTASTRTALPVVPAPTASAARQGTPHTWLPAKAAPSTKQDSPTIKPGLTLMDIRPQQPPERPPDQFGPFKLEAIQANLQGSKAATLETLEFIRTNNISLALLQEPYTRGAQGKFLPVGASGMTFAAVQDERPLAAIAVNNPNIDVLFLPHLSTPTRTVICISAPDFCIHLASIYLPPHSPIDTEVADLQRLLDALAPHPIVLAGDFNCRSEVWHDEVTDRRAPILEEFALTNGLDIANQPGHLPTFETLNGRSHVDLTFTTPALAPLVREWQVREDVSCADHRAITWTLANGAPPQVPTTLPRVRVNHNDLDVMSARGDLDRLHHRREVSSEAGLPPSPGVVDGRSGTEEEGVSPQEDPTLPQQGPAVPGLPPRADGDSKTDLQAGHKSGQAPGLAEVRRGGPKIQPMGRHLQAGCRQAPHARRPACPPIRWRKPGPNHNPHANPPHPSTLPPPGR
ncbi:hypothetical protein ILUMI_07837 [Ignelater luminosus]|uniref:Endonuclease/exonuclease/phosphatase domain-containing protein n=1 Tax=Ignelater luminosus TaxID=2038154 RepID=A0A8K0GHM0_IGNLU|nr:hypothetical protein ILUMI_07837 [Ignelater luminosus]